MIRVLHGDCRDVLRTMPAESVHCCVTSPPYFGLRDYGVAGQIGLEPTPDAYVVELVAVFREVRRVLRKDGTVWLNLGDSYANDGKWGGHTGGKHVSALHCSPIGRNKRYTGLKPKDLIGVPWRAAFALQADGWWLRSSIIWHKPNPMPESVTDRPTSAHENIFLLTKSASYWYDHEAVKEPAEYGRREGTNWKRPRESDPRDKRRDPAQTVRGADPEAGRNLRNVWTVATQPYSEAHFATFPPALIEPCIKAGTSERGCCPHCGAGWVRDVERQPPPDFGRGTTLKNQGQIGQQQRNALGPQGNGLGVQSSKTVGWSPSCSCPAHTPIPATVLDPFAGAGTTGLVADRLGRNAILIELNPAYAAMSERRLHSDAGMFASVQMEAAE